MSKAAGLGALVRPASHCCSVWSQGPEVFGDQGLFGSQDRGAAEQLDAFAMAPGVEGPALAPLASDPGVDWVRTYCQKPALCVKIWVMLLISNAAGSGTLGSKLPVLGWTARR